jgi:hypothetical protein
MKILIALGIIVTAVAAHFFAIHTGIYAAQIQSGVVWFDNVLHAGVGVAFGLIWLHSIALYRPESSRLFTALSLIIFVVLIAGAWELFEYGFYLVGKSGIFGFKVYQQSLNEAFFDSFSNIAGALLLIIGQSVHRLFTTTAKV